MTSTHQYIFGLQRLTSDDPPNLGLSYYDNANQVQHIFDFVEATKISPYFGNATRQYVVILGIYHAHHS